jgi:glycosyltransferase involved in cell wall biosynthesis
MRIAIVSTPYLPIPPKKYGGTERVIYYLVKGLKELGHEPILLAPADSEVDCEIIPICETSMYFPQKRELVAEFEAKLKEIEHYTKSLIGNLKNSVDIFHSHGFDMRDYSYLPNVTTLHGPINLENLEYYLQRKELNYVSISRNQQESFPELNYVGVVYNGEDPHEFPIVEEPENYLAFLGRFDSDKNPHLAIELAISLGIPIRLGGKIDFKGDLYFEDMIQPFLSHPLVEYVGELGMEEKIELLSKAKVNLHPTGFREPFGLTILEAAYSGTPTIAISRGSMPELIEEGRTGMLIEDFVQAYHIMDEVYAMDRGYISSRSRQLFNYKQMAKQYVQVYEKVINQVKNP